MLTCADVCRILCDACGGSAALLERVRALFARFIYVFLDIQGPDVDEVRCWLPFIVSMSIHLYTQYEDTRI